MKKILTTLLAVVMMLSFASICVNAEVTYTPSRREKLYVLNEDGTNGSEYATFIVSDAYYAGLDCFTITNRLIYSDDSIYNVAILIEWTAKFATGVTETKSYHVVATNKNYTNTRYIYPETDGTITGLTIVHAANPENTVATLSSLTSVKITYEYE